ncbi:MAG: plasmid pRiA4b ORF-3 family protein [Candidatus Kapabacteria bacterium]|nr:plasmid pRiA4b ORF-3 family protein [Candidatus Kapabacteria bacterium]
MEAIFSTASIASRGRCDTFDSHLQLFVIKGTEYANCYVWDQDDDGMSDENGMTLLAVEATFTYAHDMGDDWSHTVVVLQCTTVPLERTGPWVVGGPLWSRVSVGGWGIAESHRRSRRELAARRQTSLTYSRHNRCTSRDIHGGAARYVTLLPHKTMRGT